jgi:hypothetical protein
VTTIHDHPNPTSGKQSKNGGKTQHPGGLSPLASELLKERAENRPIWLRAPKRGAEPYTGLSRAKLYQLAGEGRIVTRCLREKGRVRGVRLFLLNSILEYIEHSPTGMKVEGCMKSK